MNIKICDPRGNEFEAIPFENNFDVPPPTIIHQINDITNLSGTYIDDYHAQISRRRHLNLIYFDLVHTIINRLPVAETAVKGLEFHHYDSSGTHLMAKTIIDTYHVRACGKYWKLEYGKEPSRWGGTEFPHVFKDRNEALLAAQAEYRYAIISGISPKETK